MESAFDKNRHLAMRDIMVGRLKEPTMLRIRIKASKTDSFRAGVDVFVGRTGEPLYPVTAVLNYLVARGRKPGPLFQFPGEVRGASPWSTDQGGNS